MNSLKPLILLTILGGVGFGVYRSLNKGPDEPPAGTDTSVNAAPEIKLGDPSALTAKDGGAKSARPNLLQAAPGGSAPPFQAGDAARGTAAEIAPPFSSDSQRASAGDSSRALNSGSVNDGVAQAYAQPTTNPFGGPTDPLAGRAEADPAGAATRQNSAMGTESFIAAWPTIQPKLAAGQLREALKDLTAWYNHPSLTSSEQQMVTGLLNELAGTVIYSRDHLLAAPYRVLPGESLADIAQRHRVTAELLAKINELDPAAPAIEPGQEIKVLPGPFTAIVEVGSDRLTLMLDGCYAGSFLLAQLGSAVASRVEAGTPVEFTVSQKTTAPIYNGPQGEIEADDPANPLGQYLLALGGELAIHGTNPQATAPAEQPSGGIRVSATDIADVYDILTIGSRVIVRK
ncbi:MAG: LysM peptidoglycan-binding domain-containing protein [Pirellulales bacterium]